MFQVFSRVLKRSKGKPKFHDKECDVKEISKQAGSRNFPDWHWIQSGVFEVYRLCLESVVSSQTLICDAQSPLILGNDRFENNLFSHPC